MGIDRVSQDALRPLLAVAAVGAVLAVAGNLAAQTPASAPAPGPTPARVSKAALKAASANPTDSQTVEKLLSGLPQVTFDDNGTPRIFYLWDGDMLLERTEVQAMLMAPHIRQRRGLRKIKRGELLLQERPDGRPSVWAAADRRMTYAVDCSTFPSQAQCTTVKAALGAAAADWQRICPSCGVRFDAIEAPAGIRPSAGGNPRFVVRYDANATDYVAIAFFANDDVYNRYVGIAPLYFRTSFDQTGVLRHELGHVLGYRHEHVRAPTGCYSEDNDWKPLTPYTPKSVMHYLCGGGGSKKLDFQKNDIDGHKLAYGG